MKDSDTLKAEFLAGIARARTEEDGPVAAARAVAWWARMLAAPGARLEEIEEAPPTGGPSSPTLPGGPGYTGRSPQVNQRLSVQRTLFDDD